MIPISEWSKELTDTAALVLYDQQACGGIMAETGWTIMYAAAIPVGGIDCDSDTDTPILTDRLVSAFREHGLNPKLEIAQVPGWSALAFTVVAVEPVAKAA